MSEILYTMSIDKNYFVRILDEEVRNTIMEVCGAKYEEEEIFEGVSLKFGYYDLTTANCENSIENYIKSKALGRGSANVDPELIKRFLNKLREKGITKIPVEVETIVKAKFKALVDNEMLEGGCDKNYISVKKSNSFSFNKSFGYDTTSSIDSLMKELMNNCKIETKRVEIPI